ncbi:hypothetical protein ABZT43_21795 [Streptomyces sp. NPDC005349]|uniref:hypothetical protein n=1 Tax=Streptomyces sp. NPDC005349 TaxID=3157037 RepID=UPI0033BC0455
MIDAPGRTRTNGGVKQALHVHLHASHDAVQVALVADGDVQDRALRDQFAQNTRVRVRLREHRLRVLHRDVDEADRPVLLPPRPQRRPRRDDRADGRRRDSPDDPHDRNQHRAPRPAPRPARTS